MCSTELMKAQCSLTPSEAKRLIAKAVVQMPEVKRALKKSKVIVKEGSTTSAISEELTGMPVASSGRISPMGTMGSRNTGGRYRIVIDQGEISKPELTDDITYWAELFPQLCSDDVFITGANALDPQKRAGVMAGGATLSSAHLIPAFRAQGVNVIITVGWEKLIPNSIEEAVAVASRTGTDVSMGMPVGIVPLYGTVVTETDALHILVEGLTITVISAGGVKGAEGATTFVIDGVPAAVKKAWSILSEVKGARMSSEEGTIEDCEPQGELCKGFIIRDGIHVPKHHSCVYREKDSPSKLFR